MNFLEQLGHLLAFIEKPIKETPEDQPVTIILDIKPNQRPVYLEMMARFRVLSELFVPNEPAPAGVVQCDFCRRGKEKLPIGQAFCSSQEEAESCVVYMMAKGT